MAHNLDREWQMSAEKPERATTEQRAPWWSFIRLSTRRMNLIPRAGRLTRPNGHLYALVSLLGLEADACQRRLSVVRPCLPAFLDRLVLERLQVADARVDLVFTRHAGGTVDVASTVRCGDLDIELARA
jgi:hypothetical protein